MSHWTDIQIEIRDLGALNDACREMQLELVRAAVGQKVQARGYAGATIECDALVRLKGPYDVALIRQPDGQYKAQVDWWRGHAEKEIGKNAGRLSQLYGTHKVTRDMRAKGYNVARNVDSKGVIRLSITGARL